MGGKNLHDFPWNKVICNSLGKNRGLGEILVYF